MKYPLLVFPFTFLLLGGVFALWQLIHHDRTNSYVLTPLPETSQTATVIKPNPLPRPTVAVAPTTTTPVAAAVLPTPVAPRTYLEITSGCKVTLSEDCIHAYSRPSETATVRAALRIGAVLLVAGSTTTSDGTLWHEITFDEGLRYPERLDLPWFIRADAGTLVRTEGATELSSTTPTSTKSLLVDRSDQRLYAYEGDRLVKTYTISTGRELTPTPRGTFRVYRKTPTRYMQGPIPGITEKYYDLPGVPWNLYFTQQGAIVHGAYWHNSFGSQYSNGCVNLPLTDARSVYEWADLGMTVTVRD